jgi:hypothetical protein
VGLDRLKPLTLLLVVLVAAACDRGGRPRHLLYGQPAAEFRPVRGSVMSVARVVRRATLGRRLESCLFRADRPNVASDTKVVERIGVDDESLTFANRRATGVYACDGGVDPAGEHRPPWCGEVFGALADGRLLDPRLDVICRDRRGAPLAYAFVEPVAGAHWIGVGRGRYTEVYEVVAGLPVRVATTRRISLERARATFEITQYDLHGRELVRGDLEAAVAG